jgi:hypothetical protein
MVRHGKEMVVEEEVRFVGCLRCAGSELFHPEGSIANKVPSKETQIETGFVSPKRRQQCERCKVVA